MTTKTKPKKAKAKAAMPKKAADNPQTVQEKSISDLVVQEVLRRNEFFLNIQLAAQGALKELRKLHLQRGTAKGLAVRAFFEGHEMEINIEPRPEKEAQSMPTIDFSSFYFGKKSVTDSFDPKPKPRKRKAK